MPLEEAVVAEGEHPRPTLLRRVDERLGVRKLHGGELVRPSQVDEEPRRLDLRHPRRALGVLLQACGMAITAHDTRSLGLGQPRHAPSVSPDPDPFEALDPRKDPAERLGLLPRHGQDLAHG